MAKKLCEKDKIFSEQEPLRQFSNFHFAFNGLSIFCEVKKNMMHQFNRTMEYLESKLDAEVDLQKFQQLSGYSYALFSRLFSILADMTLAEYLRNRRLSEAVTDLREGS